MRAIWKGSVRFGLVNIPVALYPATTREELRFRLLRAGDLSPVNYKRVAAADGKEVPWDQIVKGYEYEKGRFVVLKDADFKRVDVEATQTVDILDFVAVGAINPMHFYKPYYLVPQKGGIPAYVLLRDVLRKEEKTGIAKVVIRTRQHLASVRPLGDALVLELMHFAHELRDTSGLAIPKGQNEFGKREMAIAANLVEQLTVPWDPSRYTDDYQSALMALIEEKRQSGDQRTAATAPTRRSRNVVDLLSALESSLEKARTNTKSQPAGKARSGAKRKRGSRRAA